MAGLVFGIGFSHRGTEAQRHGDDKPLRPSSLFFHSVRFVLCLCASVAILFNY